MALTIGHLLLKLSASTASFAKDLDRAKSLAFGNAKEIERSFAIIKGIAVAGATAFGTALLAMSKHAIDLGDRLQELSQQTGVSVEFLDKLRQVGNKSGTDIEGLAGGMKFLARAMVDAQKKGSEQAMAFRALGVSATDTHGRLRPVESVATEIFKAISRLSDGAVKAEIATRLFGKSGADAIPSLNELGRTIDTIKPKITTEFAKAADQLMDSLGDLKDNTLGWAAALAGPLVKGLNDAFAAMNQVRPTVKVWTPFGPIEQQAIATRSDVLAKFQKQIEDFRHTGVEGGLRAADFGTLTAGFEAGARAAADFRARIIETNHDVEKLKMTVGLLDLATLGIPGRAVGERPTLFTAEELGARGMLAALRELKAQGIGPAVGALAEMREEAMRIWEETRTPQERFALEMGRLNELVGAGALDWETYRRAAKQALDELNKSQQLTVWEKGLKDLKASMKDFGDASAFALSDAIVQGEGFRRVLAGILQDLARTLIYFLVIRPLFQALLGVFGFSEGGMIPAAAKGALIPRRQMGGGTPFGRGPFWVGEEGRELFFPPPSGGMILPHGISERVAGGRMGGGVVINQQVDARGADLGVVTRVNAAMIKANNKLLVEALRERSLRTVG